jgi:NADH:ubiquinone oxidoreductase subunit E
MKYMRKIAENSWADYETNTEVAKVINTSIIPILENIQEYKRNWLQHVSRMPSKR